MSVCSSRANAQALARSVNRWTQPRPFLSGYELQDNIEQPER